MLFRSAVWAGMIEKAAAGGGLGRSIFMSDFSGSMQWPDGATPYWVSVALGILGSQVCSGAFRGRLMTFDSTPTWHTFPAEADLFGCLESMSERIGCGMSTDFQAAMDLVLGTLKEQRVRPGEEPENLIVLTDMGWDEAAASNGEGAYTGNTYSHVVKTAPWQTHVEMIQEAFRRAGEDMWGVGQGWQPPRIVIWNLATSYSSDHHARADVPGVAMLSGWSPTQFAMLQKEGPRQLTAYEMLRVELDDPQYDRVRAAVRGTAQTTEETANHANGWGSPE